MSAETAVAISIACLTFVLAVATVYYAVQTRRTVDAMERQEEDRRRHAIAGIRSALVSEIRQIREWDAREKRGIARLYMPLSTTAWRATFAHPEALTDEIRERLFTFYDEVERMNAALTLMILARIQTSTDPTSTLFINASAMGLERATSPEFMFRDIEGVIDMIKALPSDG